MRQTFRLTTLGLIGVVCLFMALPVAAQQIAVPRVDSMPDLPSPYVMRDWKQVARDYDAFVFDWNADRGYPSLIFSSTSSNYPALDGFGLQSYVGMDLSTGEAINVIPAVVGASLVGIDKSAQDRDYVEQSQHWFNKANGIDLYLNNYSSTTGGDWWYETMPNVFFYQLADLYPGIGEFDSQIIQVADRLVEEVDALGGDIAPWTSPSFDFRAFSFSTMSGVTGNWTQPEAGGAIAWLLYSAYNKTGDERYRIAAELSMDFFQSWSSNPSYEIQMPYGVLTAARMNAELGAGYDVEKMVNWVFEMSDVRNWGVVVGTWGGYDVSGLVGEVDSDGYAFMMNGYQTASAMVPMVRYDDRFAHAIGKWMLNLANASRLYYTPFLPDSLQDGEWWTNQYDTLGVMGHEAIRQNFEAEGRLNGIYASGDASYGGWAPLNFALYGASHVGYLGAIVDTTNIEGILQLDVRATDFYQDDAYPTWLLYNPLAGQQSVTVKLESVGSVDLWDAVSNQTIASGVSGTASVDIAADAAVLLVEVPSGATVVSENGIMTADGVAVDFNDGSSITNRAPRIRSVGTESLSVVKATTADIYATIFEPDGDTPTYSWSVDVGEISGTTAMATYTAPDSADTATVQLIVSDPGSLADTAWVTITVTPSLPPVIESLEVIPSNPRPGEEIEIVCHASDPDGDSLSFVWFASDGLFTQEGDTAVWTAPTSEGVVQITCTVSDPFGLQDTGETSIIVGDLVLHLEFNGNANDSSPFGNDGTMVGASYVSDRHGTSNSALHLTGPDSRVTVPVSASLNGQDGITVMFWMKPDHIPTQDEYYIISHGSWENRWKLTLGSDAKVKWTVNNGVSPKDIASVSDISEDLVHIAASFDGARMRLFVNGTEEVQDVFNGTIAQTEYDLLVGQKLPGETAYNFVGDIDEVRVYNRKLTDVEIRALIDLNMGIADGQTGIPENFAIASAWPNPFNDRVTVRLSIPEAGLVRLELFNLLGQRVALNTLAQGAGGWRTVSFDLSGLASGTYILQAKLGHQVSEARRITLVR